MNRRIIRGFVLLLAALSGLSSSCGPEPIVTPEDNHFETGLFVLNEGVYQMNNSTISYIEDGHVTKDLFLEQNGRGLGDTGNDLQRYGLKLYCVVNNSHRVEVMNLDGTSVKGISLPGKQPRYVAFHNGKAYVSCFDGDVVRIDTNKLEVEATLHSGLNPEGICVCKGKLYVANSGGLNFPDYGHTVSVIDLATFTLLKEIEVGINPGLVQAYRDRYVYVVSRGDYGAVPYNLHKIDALTDELVKTYDWEVLGFYVYGQTGYMYHYDFGSHASWIRTMDLESDQILTENFITDGTKIETPYGICVNPLNGDVYISDAFNFTVSGKVFQFDQHGVLKESYTVGINPGHLLFCTPAVEK